MTGFKRNNNTNKQNITWRRVKLRIKGFMSRSLMFFFEYILIPVLVMYILYTITCIIADPHIRIEQDAIERCKLYYQKIYDYVKLVEKRKIIQQKCNEAYNNFDLKTKINALKKIFMELYNRFIELLQRYPLTKMLKCESITNYDLIKYCILLLGLIRIYDFLVGLYTRLTKRKSI